MIFDTNIMPSDGAVAVQQYLSKVGITLDLQLVTSVQQDDFIQNGWKNGFIAFRIFGGPGYVSGVQFSLSPNGNVFVSVQRPTDFGVFFNDALAAVDVTAIEATGQKLNMSLYDDSTVIPLVISYRNIFVQQNYVHDTNLFKGGAVAPWTPAKAWLSN